MSSGVIVHLTANLVYFMQKQLLLALKMTFLKIVSFQISRWSKTRSIPPSIWAIEVGAVVRRSRRWSKHDSGSNRRRPPGYCTLRDKSQIEIALTNKKWEVFSTRFRLIIHHVYANRRSYSAEGDGSFVLPQGAAKYQSIFSWWSAFQLK